MSLVLFIILMIMVLWGITLLINHFFIKDALFVICAFAAIFIISYNGGCWLYDKNKENMELVGTYQLIEKKDAKSYDPDYKAPTNIKRRYVYYYDGINVHSKNIKSDPNVTIKYNSGENKIEFWTQKWSFLDNTGIVVYLP